MFRYTMVGRIFQVPSSNIQAVLGWNVHGSGLWLSCVLLVFIILLTVLFISLCF